MSGKKAMEKESRAAAAATMTEDQEIKDLYSMIPEVIGCTNCGNCCGPVPFAPVESKKVVPIKKVFKGEDLSCPYRKEGKCSIYENRPLMCRLFGATDPPDLMCPNGAKAEKTLSKKKTSKIIRRYQQLFKSNLFGG